MTAMKNTSDEFVIMKVRENFAFLTGERLPEPKKPGLTHVDGNDLATHFKGGMSPIHMIIFVQAVREAESRGLLNAVESSMCAEVLAILSEV